MIKANKNKYIYKLDNYKSNFFHLVYFVCDLLQMSISKARVTQAYRPIGDPRQPLIPREKLVHPDWLLHAADSCCEIYC